MMYQFFSGGMMVCTLFAGFFFLKFWNKTHEELFKSFAISFFLMCAERCVLSFLGTQNEPSPLVYLIRLIAFLIIIFAIVKKNKESSNAENT